jgi:hypothetical protein
VLLSQLEDPFAHLIGVEREAEALGVDADREGVDLD